MDQKSTPNLTAACPGDGARNHKFHRFACPELFAVKWRVADEYIKV